MNMKRTFFILLISVLSALSVNAQYTNSFNNLNTNNNVPTVRIDTNS